MTFAFVCCVVVRVRVCVWGDFFTKSAASNTKRSISVSSANDQSTSPLLEKKMADAIMNLLEQSPATGLVGGAIVAAAVGFTAVKALGGGKTAPQAASASAQKKKKKSKAAKKKSEVDQAPAKQPESASDINLDDFVSVRLVFAFLHLASRLHVVSFMYGACKTELLTVVHLHVVFL